jgi:NAD(P) transhydrogenase subunit alpha
MTTQSLSEKAAKIKESAQELFQEIDSLQDAVRELGAKTSAMSGADSFVFGLTIFLLACFVGYYVVWKVTPALHSPLMSVTNAISSVIIVGALMAAGPALTGLSNFYGFIAVVLASVNIFGGFIVTQRMLAMFAKNK